MSLVEAIMAVVFLGIAIPPLIFAISTILEKSIETESISKAVLLAQAKMEYMITVNAHWGFSALSTDNTKINPGYPGPEVVYWADNYHPGGWTMYWGGMGEYGPKPQFLIWVEIETIQNVQTELNFTVSRLTINGEVPFEDPPFDPTPAINENCKRIKVFVYKYCNEPYDDFTDPGQRAQHQLMAQLCLIVNAYVNQTVWW